MPRTTNLDKYDSNMKDMMDKVGEGMKPIRIRFDEARFAFAKRARFYAMIKALEKELEATIGKLPDNSLERDRAINFFNAYQKAAKTRLSKWYRVNLKVVECGTESSYDGRGEKKFQPAEFLVIHQDQTKDAQMMAKALADSLGVGYDEEKPTESGIATDLSMDALAGKLDFAGMLAGADEELSQEVTVLEEDKETGMKKMSDGRVLNQYGAEAGWWK